MTGTSLRNGLIASKRDGAFPGPAGVPGCARAGIDVADSEMSVHAWNLV